MNERKAALKAKQVALEAAGWEFQRKSKKRGWVRHHGGTRSMARAVAHAWAEHHRDERMTP